MKDKPAKPPRDKEEQEQEPNRKNKTNRSPTGTQQELQGPNTGPAQDKSDTLRRKTPGAARKQAGARART